MAVHELQDLAFGDEVGRFGQHLHHAHVSDLDHHLEGARIDEIAHEHGGGIAEQCVGGRATAAQRRLIDDVVVQERRRMNEFDDGGKAILGISRIAECTAG